MSKSTVVKEKSFAFALRCIKLYRYLRDDKNEYVISKQILRSGTSIGANVKEGIFARAPSENSHPAASTEERIASKTRPPELVRRLLVNISVHSSALTPLTVFFITVFVRLLSLEPGVNTTPFHWRDIMSNEISATTFPVRSPPITTGFSGVPQEVRDPLTTSEAPSWKHSLVPASSMSRAPDATTRES